MLKIKKTMRMRMRMTKWMLKKTMKILTIIDL